MFAQLQQQNKRFYSEIIGDIKVLLNSRTKKDSSLYPLLQELNLSYGITLSREFLNNLCEINNANKKSQKIRVLFKKSNLTTRKELKLTSEHTATLKELEYDYGIRNDYGQVILSKVIVCEPYIKKSGKYFNIIKI